MKRPKVKTFPVYECPHCGAGLNNAPRRITPRMKRFLTARRIRWLKKKVIRLAPETVLTCRTCDQKSRMDKRGKWRVIGRKIRGGGMLTVMR